jgi:hypothetical protein
MAAFAKSWRRECRAYRDQGALVSLGHPCERLPAGVRDPHAHKIGLSSIVGDHALTLRGCEAGLDQFDHHVHREPVRTQDRLAVTVMACGKQFEGAAAVRIGTAIVASGRHRLHGHDYRHDPPRGSLAGGSRLATTPPPQRAPWPTDQRRTRRLVRYRPIHIKNERKPRSVGAARAHPTRTPPRAWGFGRRLSGVPKSLEGPWVGGV